MGELDSRIEHRPCTQTTWNDPQSSAYDSLGTAGHGPKAKRKKKLKSIESWPINSILDGFSFKSKVSPLQGLLLLLK